VAERAHLGHINKVDHQLGPTRIQFAPSRIRAPNGPQFKVKTGVIYSQGPPELLEKDLASHSVCLRLSASGCLPLTVCGLLFLQVNDLASKEPQRAATHNEPQLFTGHVRGTIFNASRLLFIHFGCNLLLVLLSQTFFHFIGPKRRLVGPSREAEEHKSGAELELVCRGAVGRAERKK